MGVLCPVVKPLVRSMFHAGHDVSFRSLIGSELVRHHNAWRTALAFSSLRVRRPAGTAGAESIFTLLKRERIRRKVYRSRDEACQDVFDYIEMFYNPKRKHVRNAMLSPVEFENRQKS